jgi:hypothetical protein
MAAAVCGTGELHLKSGQWLVYDTVELIRPTENR